MPETIKQKWYRWKVESKNKTEPDYYDWQDGCFTLVERSKETAKFSKERE